MGGNEVKPRIYVLDTNVLMHDPMSITRFEEHDVFIPLEVLEELDNNKKGHSEISRNAREACRRIDAIISGDQSDISKGFSLEKESGGLATGRLFLQDEDTSLSEKPDNRILDAAKALSEKHSNSHVVLVTKDTIMRIKGCRRKITVEDYHNDQVIEDTDLLYSGSRILTQDFWDTQVDIKSGKSSEGNWYEVSGPLVAGFYLNEFVHFSAEKAFSARVVKKSGNKATLRVIHDYRHEKSNVWGIPALNNEQNYALNLLLDPEIDFVTLIGKAGSGKTLLALAAGLAQTIGEKLSYSEIIVTRATVPIGDEIGFLPGTEEEKMSPWMGALDDNMDFLLSNEDKSVWGQSATRDLIRNRVKVMVLPPNLRQPIPVF